MIRTLILSLITLLFSILQLSAKGNNVDAVSMVSYEQSWLDSKGTIALKNNTQSDIYNVSFVIEYLDMNNKPLDYKEFSYEINIAPGKTRKLDIPAYEHSRNYHYYKTKDNLGHPSFKIKYEFKGFNTQKEIPKNSISSSSQNQESNIAEYTTFIIIIVFAILLLGIGIGLYIAVAVIAQRLNRNPVIWLLLSFIATPLLIILILLVIGKVETEEY